MPLPGRPEVTAATGERHEARLAGRETSSPGRPTSPTCPRVATSASQRRRTGWRSRSPARGAERLPPPFRHRPADEVPVELRGAGTASPEVRNFGIPRRARRGLDHRLRGRHAGRQLVLVPAAQARRGAAGGETELEEIYYFEVEDRPDGAAEVRIRSATSGSTARRTRPIDVLAEVRTGDVVLVPHGWHGPAMAPPGYDMYYLNVMAGPGAERAWLICDDPAHGWVRDTWAEQDVDPRLPDRRHRDDATQTVRLTVAQAVVRFLRGQWTRARRRAPEAVRRLLRHLRARQRRRHRPGAAAVRARRDRRGRACRTSWPATSRRWCTRRSATPGRRTACRPGPAPPPSAPARPTCSPAPRWPPINRLPVLLLPSGHLRHPGRRARCCRSWRRRTPGRHRQRRVPPAVAVLRPGQPARAAAVGAAGRDARAHRPGRDRRGHRRPAPGRAGRGVRLAGGAVRRAGLARRPRPSPEPAASPGRPR